MSTCPPSLRRIATQYVPALLCAILPAYAAADATLAWLQQTRGVSVALDANDSVYTVDYEQALGAEMTLTKRHSNGTHAWVASYDQTDSTKWERASWVVADSVGNAVVCGTLMSGYSNPVEAASIVMKFDANGALVWRRVFESGFDGSSVKKCLVDRSDNVYVFGMGSGPNGRVSKVKKFDPDGTALWSYFDSAGIGAAVNVKLTPDYHLLLTGRSITGSFNGYAKIDLNGNAVWNLPAVPSLTVGDSAGDAFGNTYVVHGQYGVANPGTVVKKLDPAGDLLWENVYPLAGFRIEAGSDNAAVVSGFPNSGTPGAAFVKLNDKDGAVIWSNRDADGPLALLAHAHMLLDVDNNAYLAAGTLSEMAVTRVNADGTSGWTRTIAYGYAQAIALGNTDRSVYVVGGTTARLTQGDLTLVPTQPTPLSYFDLKPNSIYLGWSDNSTNETGFTLERCQGAAAVCDATPGNWAVIATLAENVSTYVDGALSSDVTYSWRVRAFNGAGVSPYSNTLSVTTPPLPPLAPSNLKAQAKRVGPAVEVRLSWLDRAGNETSFTVERCTGTGCTNFAAIASLPANTQKYTDPAVARGTRYEYRVMASGKGGNSGYSNIATIKTP